VTDKVKSRFFGRLIRNLILLVLFILSIILVPYFIVNDYHKYTLSSEDTENSSVKIPKTAIVLGSGVRSDGTPGDVLTSRLDLSIDLYKKGAVNKIVLSGYNPSGVYNEPRVMKNYLKTTGLPEASLVVDDGGHDTLGTCQSTIEDLGIIRAIIITQPGHLDRAMYICRSLGMEAYGAEAIVTGTQGAIYFQSLREAGSNIKAVGEITAIQLGIEL